MCGGGLVSRFASALPNVTVFFLGEYAILACAAMFLPTSRRTVYDREANS